MEVKLLWTEKESFQALLYKAEKENAGYFLPVQDGCVILSVLKDSLQIHIQGAGAGLERDQIIVVPQGIPFRIIRATPQTEFICIIITEKQSKHEVNSIWYEFIKQMNKPFLTAPSEMHQAKLHTLFDSFIEEAMSHRNYYNIVVKLILEQILIEIMRMQQDYIPTTAHVSDSCSEMSMTIKRAIQYINLHYDEKVTLPEVAGELWINPSYLSRQFKMTVGISFTEFVTQRRIYQAKFLLANTNQSISQIAVSVGFGNIPYFNNVFRRKTGKSPTEFRKEHTRPKSKW